MLYQVAYTEFWFSDILWPDFTEKHLLLSILDYQKEIEDLEESSE